MKLRARIICLLVIAFICLVSFLILQPELRRPDTGNTLAQENDVVLGEDSQYNEPQGHAGVVPRGGVMDGRPAAVMHDPTKQKLIDKYLQLYDVSWDIQLSDNAWQLADSWVTTRHIHENYVPQLGAVLHRLATARIMSATVGYKGTQLKLSLLLSGGRRVSFKPKWYERDFIVHGLPYDGRDRHNAEIAAYHIQRLLGYNRAPITVGRSIDLRRDILPVAEDILKDTFFTNGSNTCFYGKCLYCKTREDGVCGEGAKLEGAVALWLPSGAKFKKWRSPWQRVYDDPDHRKARWEVEADYCDYVRGNSPYDTGPRLMDLIDAVVLDYIIGNADRHHYETIESDEESIIVLFDSAKGFRNPHYDERTILAPLYQCCQIRNETVQRLEELRGGVMTSVLRHIMSRDPTAPVLADVDYEAMERRIETLLNDVRTCVEKRGKENVIVYDHYMPKPLS